MLRTTSFTIILGTALFFTNIAEAATLFFTPGTGEFGLNKEIVADLKIDSDGVGVNAGQATIRFPKDMLEVKSVDKTDSAFNFWLEEPSFSNTDGVITFVGGTPYGISGASIKVISITFLAKNSGTARLSFADSAVTASDASGTNVLSKSAEAAFTITGETVPPVITPPTQIKRESVEPVGLPTKPALTVPLYSNPTEWYNHSNIFTVSWTIPLDISGVVATINKQPAYSPSVSEGLFDSKMFSALSDGVWYLHARFKNDIGWGPVTHYRIAVDTKAPLPFEITTNESEATDNPTPTFSFKASDALSGLRAYRVRVDNGNWVSIPTKDFKGSYKLAPQVPGKHVLTIKAVDNAGNSIENTFDYETIPLASPIFTFATEKIYSNTSAGLSFNGTALPSTEILFTIKKGNAIVAESTVPVDISGNWVFAYGETLRNGRYVATIQSKDSRGALSLVVTAPEIQVTGKYTNTIIIIIVVLIGALMWGYFYHKSRRERTNLRVQVAERDTANVFDMIKTDIQKLEDAQKTPTTADDEYIADKLKKNVEKMSSYVKDG
ncbi:MAG: hypothetical protein CO060_02405, partial [Candidatus Yonathbacteria bacterium CG_4_9_14_0_2_um_filter_43_16]